MNDSFSYLISQILATIVCYDSSGCVLELIGGTVAAADIFESLTMSVKFLELESGASIVEQGNSHFLCFEMRSYPGEKVNYLVLLIPLQEYTVVSILVKLAAILW